MLFRSGFFDLVIPRSLFFVFCISTIVILEASLISQALNALFMHASAITAQIAYTVSKASLLTALVFATKLTLETALIVEVVSAGLILLLVAVAYFMKFARHVSAMPGLKAHRRRLTRFAVFSVMNDAGTAVFNTSTDMLVIGHFLGASAAAPYYFAAQAFTYLGKLNLVKGFQTVLTPMFFTKYASDATQVNHMFQLLAKLSLFFMIPVSLVFIVLGKQAIGIIAGASYTSSYLLVAIFVVAAPIDAFALPAGLVLQACERMDLAFYGRVFAVYNLVAAVILVEPYGLAGVAIATASAIALKNAYYMVCAVKVGRVSIPGWGIARLVLNSGVAAMVALAVMLVDSGSRAVVVGVVLSTVAYVGASRINRAFTEDERELINRLLRKNVWVF